MFPEKPKRNGKRRYLLALILLLPVLLIFRNFDFGFYGDITAMTVMICSAIYLTYQLVEWLIGKLWS
jgi:hypothetical protein